MIYAFEGFELDTDSFQLRREGAVVPLEPQTFDVLLHLVQHRQRVVSKQELFDRVWGTNFVSESALTTRIKQARFAVGDDGRTQRMIRTAHGRGYQFVGDVTEHDVAATSDSPAGDPPLTELVERERELSALRAIHSSVSEGGGGHVVVLSGEAGLGKSALVHAFAASVHPTRALVGGCDDLLTPRPLGPFRDIAAAVGGDPAEALAGDVDADRAVTALTGLLQDAPSLLVVEDLHWADDATLDVIRLVARRIASLPTVLVLTYRDEEVGADHPLRRVLAVLSGARTTRLALEPLSMDAIAHLAAVAGEAVDVTDVHRVTRGNPFFVTEILSAPTTHVPPTVRDAVLGRIGRLDSDARRILQTMAVVPSRVERELLAQTFSDHLEPIQEAERCGVLGGDSSHLWFRHELARLAVERSLTAGERVHANAVVLAGLERLRDAEPSRLVHHAQQAGDRDALLRHAERAADEAVRLRSYRQALEYLAILLDGERAERRDAVRWLTQRSYVLYALNRLEEATASGREAVELAEQVEPSEHIEAFLVLARAAFWTEGPMAARRCVERAITLLGPVGEDPRHAAALAGLARARSNLCTVGIVAEPDPEVVEFARRSLAVAEALGRSDLQSHALQYLGSGRLALGDARGFADVERAVELAEIDKRDELPVRACVNAAGSCYRAGRLDDAVRYAELGLLRARGGEFSSGEYRLELTIAAVLASRGDWARAEERLRELLDRSGEPGIMEPLARSVLARLVARRGAHADAARILEPALAAAAPSDEIQLAGPVAAAALESWWLAGASGDPPAIVERALTLGIESRHRSSVAELTAYLRRAGRPAPVPPIDAPGPWASTLAGDHRLAASDWLELGERYEAAVETALLGDIGALEALGASASVAAISEARASTNP